jgi:hypothetical protein
MSEVRCPMCSKPNPEDAEACEFCGARIKPLFIGSEPEDERIEERPSTVPSEDQPAEEREETDWLNRMRGGIEEDEADQTGDLDQVEDAPDRGSTDLLGRFKGLGLAEDDEGSEQDLGEVDEAQADEVEEDESITPVPERGSTDLLGRFRGLGLAPDDEESDQVSDDVVSDQVEDQEPAEKDLPERGSTDLLGRLSDLGLSEEEASAAEMESEEIQEEAIEEAQFESVAIDEPDQGEGELVWKELAESVDEPEPTGVSDELYLHESDDVVPEWLSRVRERKSEEAEVEDGKDPEKEKDVDWLSGLREETISTELEDSTPEEELEKAPPFLELEADIDETKAEDAPDSEPFVGESEPIYDPLGESESLKDLFKELESEVAAVESIASEDDGIGRFDEDKTSRVDLDDLFTTEVEDDSLLEEIELSKREVPFEPLEIEKGTSPLQDLFEELDKKLQTGELPPLEPDVIPGPDSEEDVDTALEKLLEEFDDSEKAEIGIFPSDDLEDDLGRPERDLPLEDLFSEFQVSPDGEHEAGEEDVDEDPSALEQVFGEIELPLDHTEDEFEGAFDGVEAPSVEEITKLGDVFAEVEHPDDEDALSLEEAFADLEERSEAETDIFDDVLAEVGEIIDQEPVVEDPVQEEVEPPSEEDIAAIAELFGDVDAQEEEPDSTIDSGILREITGEVHPDAWISEVAPDQKSLEAEVSDDIGEEAGLDFDFEPAEIEPEALAPGSDQLAAAFGLEEVDEEDVELLSTAPIGPDDELPVPTKEELEGYTPSWLQDGVPAEEIAAAQDVERPHVPALIMDEDEGEFEELAEDFLAAEVSMEEMPSWLQDLGADVDEEDLEEEQPEVELARAQLPPWLEAMRPIETFKAEPEIEEVEEEEITEAAGPLAGLRGVLLAEPVVAMPRSASTGVVALDVTERQYTNTEILRQMIGEEELEQTRPEVRAAPLPVARWIISLLLILAVMLPSVLSFPTYSEPFLGPRELNPFIALMDAIPLGKPTLLVFDYEPSFAAEMDAVAGAMIDDLIGRGQPIVTLSNRPTGPLLADRMILRTGSERELVNGIDYLHLGYLSGGSTGAHLFASSPRSSIVNGFRLPDELENVTTWNMPILSEVQQLSDFSAIAIIASGSESARNWIEQFSPYVVDTPLVMVVSAGAEPMIRPYYEAEEPQVKGLLSGIQAGIKYEVWNGTLSDATQSWNGFGTAIVVTELILVAGVILGAGRWFLQRRVNAEE